MVFIEGMKTIFMDERKRFGLHRWNEDHFHRCEEEIWLFIKGMKTIFIDKRKRFGFHQGNENHFHG
ncbi:hypothetical protein E2K98_00575 [Bacillus salipaludis]|uniref:Uncharacterized protein n=1 Tax=Bacillus salipaludis TaxID=2547811 RepID=A0A4R5W0Z7_9BACI|nr:hypothetical protein [Bacillus salipaludis]MDQ6597018.1 hypothetical protein [Bacillus salipaludis]TDK64773.1 hypothetical protein E2K98_00575 [Bacillus salipaludis]